ncbi:ATP-binding protein [Ornithinicoccus hortensis]|uniref:ATP-binding protein n=1 Tax=Ornithinicoccus hortensis TaxID=82346 RepID=UPI001E4A7C7D|nr:ATP-binding protein [Ornithinicoccus hortensis]
MKCVSLIRDLPTWGEGERRGVASWGEVLGDTIVAAMRDRLLRRRMVLGLDGESYRLRDHCARNDAMRQTATGTRRPLR